jgi:hypothetical protein
MQGNVSKLLSPQLQSLMLQQADYHERCAGLATLLHSADDAPLTGALEKVSASWTELLSAYEAIQSGPSLFMLFNSTNAPPSRWIWYQLGSVRLSLVVRACRTAVLFRDEDASENGRWCVVNL